MTFGPWVNVYLGNKGQELQFDTKVEDVEWKHVTVGGFIQIKAYLLLRCYFIHSNLSYIFHVDSDQYVVFTRENKIHSCYVLQ